MTISLYDASVGSYLQILDAAQGVLKKGLDWCRDKGVDPDEVVEHCLIEDMRPLRFQVQQTVFHSAGAIETMRSGLLSFAGERPRPDYAGLQALLAQAATDLRALDPAEVNGWAGKEVLFRIPGRDDRRFTAEGYLLSFSLPNFHFHAATAYDILRARGVPLSKLDFMGALRLAD
jgi:hypothetical protein